MLNEPKRDCYCRFDPACEPHAHAPASGTCYTHGHITMKMEGAGRNGPPCIWDNTPTQRAGACFVCPTCGSSTSC